MAGVDDQEAKMTELQRQMIEDLERGGYAEGTKRHYLRALRELTQYFGRSPEALTREKLRRYRS